MVSLEDFINRVENGITLYSVINSTTRKYGSVAFIYMATLLVEWSSLEPKRFNQLVQYNKQY